MFIRLILSSLLIIFNIFSWAAGELKVSNQCQDGVAQGNYQLRTNAGQLLVTGQYQLGKKQGSFVFNNPRGAKIMQLHFVDDLLQGQVLAWYADTEVSTTESSGFQQKLITNLRQGLVEGKYQTWYANAQMRSEFMLENGEIQAYSIWDEQGKRLEIKDFEGFFIADVQSDFHYIGHLEQMLNNYPPNC